MDQTEADQKIPETPIPSKPIKEQKFNPMVLVFLIVILTVVATAAVSYILLTGKITNPLAVKTPLTAGIPASSYEPETIIDLQVSPKIEPSFAVQTSCGLPDNSFCQVLENIKAAITNKNTAAIYSYQKLQLVTCDPDGMFVPVCEGAAKGVTREGYMLGYNQSESVIYEKSQAINIVNSYITSNAVEYKGALQENNRAMIVFLVDNKLKLLAFPFKKTDDKWELNYILMGTATTEFQNLDKTILEMAN